MRRLVLTLCLLSLGSSARAQIPAGTWIRRIDGPTMAMIVEPAGTGLKITYKAVGTDRKLVEPPLMAMETQLDGKDAPLLIQGNPSGETMAVTRVDATHTSTVIKFQGKAFGTSRSELSADGKTLKIENDIAENPIGQPPGKQVEHWEKQ
jgi:hypothetical protein